MVRSGRSRRRDRRGFRFTSVLPRDGEEIWTDLSFRGSPRSSVSECVCEQSRGSRRALHGALLWSRETRGSSRGRIAEPSREEDATVCEEASETLALFFLPIPLFSFLVVACLVMYGCMEVWNPNDYHACDRRCFVCFFCLQGV